MVGVGLAVSAGLIVFAISPQETRCSYAFLVFYGVMAIVVHQLTKGD